jgi:nicotinamidase/pyrazinamidase
MEKGLTIMENDALIVVDVQNDFLPGGALAVTEGHRVIGPLNELMPRFSHVYATRDWHPRNHKSFSAHGGPWPHHCVQGSLGAEISPKLDHGHIHAVISKGTDTETEGYSAFDGTDLEQRLRAEGIERLFVAGLATDYCVKATVLDARKRRFPVVVVTDAVAAVKVKPEDEMAAINAMRAAGCTLAHSGEIR